MAIKSKLGKLTPSRERLRRRITLLSKGFSDPENLPGGEVEVYPWDHETDAWLLKNLRKIGIKSPTIIFEVAKRVTDLKNVDRLTLGDVTTILLVAKSLARSTTVTYTATCPACGHEEVCSITLPDQLAKQGEKGEDYPGWDEITLPSLGDTVRIRPVTVSDVMAVHESPKAGVSPELGLDALALVAVNGGAPDSIEEAVSYLRALIPSDFSFYRTQRDELEPKLSSEILHECSECGHRFKHSLDLGTEFFR